MDVSGTIAFLQSSAEAARAPGAPYCSFTTNSEGKMNRVFFELESGREAYNGDVLIFVTTFKTNIYDMKLALYSTDGKPSGIHSAACCSLPHERNHG